MSDSPSTDHVCPVFEVHRVGGLTSAQIDSLSVSHISRTYTELVPITSLEQLKKSNAIAIVPPEGMPHNLPKFD